MKKISALILISVIVFALLLSFLSGRALAAEKPVPPPGRIPCTDPGKDPEFNSSRPYQASPCGDSPKAYFCGNTLQIIEDTPSRRAALDTEVLPVSMPMGNKDYAADLSGAQFPIAGNTELTANSQNPTSNETIDDPTKMNEYLNWYLNGTTNRAEYGNSKNTDNGLVNFSGPAQKLLPSLIQDALRIQSVKNPLTPQTFIDTESQTTGQTTTPSESRRTEPVNHNQIVVCASRQILGLLGKMVPHECYAGNGSGAKEKVYRLEDWKDHLPPLPWDPQFQNSPEAYTKARCDWRGGSYVTIPLINKSFCIDNPLKSNEWADLYQYVPLSNTTDKNAKNLITGVGIKGLGKTEIDFGRLTSVNEYQIKQEPVLYFPHTAEVSELSDSLNKTYIPRKGTTSKVPSDSTEPENDPATGQCRIVNLRSNPGDYLFPEVRPSEVRVHVSPYTVTQIPCHNVYPQRGRLKEQEAQAEGLPPLAPYAECRGQVAIDIRMITKIPYADQIFASTTAGANSTFRKIYPKVEAGAPVSCIADIPSVTGVTYTPTDGIGKKDSFKVIGPDGSNTTDSPKLYFPHFGSVYDYFLKGIQTALRPQGFADPTPESGQYCTPPEPTECKVNIPDSAVPPKYLGAFKANFIDLANRWSANCAGPSLNLAAKCYNYVVTEAQKTKVNPAFVLTIWLNESGASNYCASGKTAQDFGVNIPALYQNMVGQLKEFLKLPDRFASCRSTPGWIEPMEAFLSRFQSSAGVCNPKDTTAAQYYAEVRDNTWQYVTGTKCIKNGKFAITWPTDTSCP